MIEDIERKALKKTTEQFIEEARKIHGDKYDYSLADYKGCKKKVKIICKSCGTIFEQTPDKHINSKQGCKNCNIVTKETFLKRAKIIHNDEYDYDLENYKNVNSVIKIRCKKHNTWFEQKARKHLEGQGCKLCHYMKSQKDFIKDVEKIFGNKIVVVSEYKGAFKNITIKCNECGRLTTRKATSVLSGYSCRYCKSSNLEKIIENFLNVRGAKYERTKIFDDLKDVNNLSYDFYIPRTNTLIECNGIQHYKWVKRFQKTLHDFHKQLHHDWLKRKYAKDNSINLIVIPYWKFRKKCINNTFLELKDVL